MGQSNIAAGATIGSNHNSRAADGEIVARRGFWPGLETNFKHNSVFASFSIIAKGNYNSELNISLPFSLISIKDDDATIRLYPGYWFKNNMYALARNVWKFNKRDKRFVKEQNIEFDFLAPDTVEEMISGTNILFDLVKEEYNFSGSLLDFLQNEDKDEKPFIEMKNVVHGNKAYIYKPIQGIRLYQKMIRFYGIREIANELINAETEMSMEKLKEQYKPADREWNNIGGQLISEADLSILFKDIKSGEINSWVNMHDRYNNLQESYSHKRLNHAIFSLLKTENKTLDKVTNTDLTAFLKEGMLTAQELYDLAYASRKKDYTNKFRISTYHSKEEMDNVLGNIDDNSFLKDYEAEIIRFIQQCEILINKLEN